MAEIQRVQIGARVETRIRGRVFRFAPKRVDGDRHGDRSRMASKERRRVCVLSRHDGRMLEHWGEGQPCHGARCSHTHMTREAVTAMVTNGILRFVPGSGNNVAAYSYGRSWKAVPSAGVKVMQLV